MAPSPPVFQNTDSNSLRLQRFIDRVWVRSQAAVPLPSLPCMWRGGRRAG